MRLIIGNPYIGSINIKRLLRYNPGIPKRRGSIGKTIDGGTSHQIGTAPDSDRIISAPIICTTAKATILRSLHLNSLSTTGNTQIHILQDGQDVFLGYIKSLGIEARPFKGLLGYTITFHVIEKLSA